MTKCAKKITRKIKRRLKKVLKEIETRYIARLKIKTKEI